jgi:hypothetical protein
MSGGKERRYAQLVESYRRPDGVPAHRVIASLGALSDLEIANLRTALEASRNGKAVVVVDAPESPSSPGVDDEANTGELAAPRHQSRAAKAARTATGRQRVAKS